MLTVFQIDGVPDRIYFCKSENFERVVRDRGVEQADVISQEISLETIMLLADGKSKVFISCLYK